MRFLGKYYSEEEILVCPLPPTKQSLFTILTREQEMIADWDLDNSGTMNVTGFLGMISALTDSIDTERELYKGRFLQTCMRTCERSCGTDLSRSHIFASPRHLTALSLYPSFILHTHH